MIEPDFAYKSLKKRLPAALPPMQALYEWLATQRALSLVFQPKDECRCPLAQFLSERFGVSIEVGDDDLSHDGLFLCEMPRDYRRFVCAVDDGLAGRELVAAFDLLLLCRRHATEWGITP